MIRTFGSAQTARKMTLFLSAVLLVAGSSNVWAKPSSDLVVVPPTEPLLLQTEVGFAAKHKKAEDWLAEATTFAKARKTTIEKELIHIMNREGAGKVTAYYTPDGKIRPDDGSHKLLAAQELIERYRLDPSKLHWTFSIPKKNDYRKSTWDQFAKDMLDHGYAHFNRAEIAESEKRGETLGQRFERLLPKSTADVHDNPMRSAWGYFFDTQGLKGTSFTPGIQFDTGEKAEDHGIHAEPGKEFDPKVQAELQNFTYGKETGPEFQNFLLSKTNPNAKKSVAAALEKGQTGFNAFTKDVKSPACVVNVLEQLIMLAQNLPAVVDFPDASEKYTQLFNEARKKAESQIDMKRVKDLVDHLLDSKKENLSRADMKYLKSARKAALTLRSAYKFFSAVPPHHAPDEYRAFTTQFGELNDALEDVKSGKPITEEIRDAAKALKKTMKKNVFDDGFEVTTPESFFEYQGKVADTIQEALDNPKLKVWQYHDLRKTARDYMYLFELINRDSPTVETHAAEQFLGSLNGRMGPLKDGLLKMKKKNGHEVSHKDLLDARTEIDSESRTDLEKLVKMIRASIPH